MHVKSLVVANCKSFRSSETITFDQEFNVLVGPNAGGKSNILDILTIVLRRFFLPPYTTNEGEDAGSLWKDIRRQDLFGDLNRHLDPHIDAPNDPVTLDLVLSVGASDVENLRTILARRDSLSTILHRFRNSPHPNLAMLDNWPADLLTEGKELRYGILNGALQPDLDDAHRVFREYLSSLQFFLLLAAEVGDIDLRPSLLFFSPYRSAAPQDLRANLSGERFLNLLAEYFNSTSRSQTSPIKIASVYFAEKKRRLEHGAQAEGYGDRWTADDDVRAVNAYMEKLGYSWELQLTDPNRNLYEITLRREGRDFAISKASSGEKEILNFLLGIFALKTRGGLIIIDEPELHLHPRWQAALRDVLADLARDTRNQVVLSTHSAVFITPDTIANVRRVARDASNTTRVIVVASGDTEKKRDLLHIVNSHNNERIFFADEVLLVEGLHDRLIFERLVDVLRTAGNVSKVVEVVEVHGKDNFDKYRQFLSSMCVPTYLAADLDYAATLKAKDLGDLFVTHWKGIDEQVLKGKKSKDRLTLAERIEEFIATGVIEPLKAVWSYIKNRFGVLRDDLSAQEKQRLSAVLAELAKEGVFVLSKGEIETYLPKDSRSLEGSVELLKPQNFLKWLEQDRKDSDLFELESIVLHVLAVPPDDQDRIRDRARDLLRVAVKARDGETNRQMGPRVEKEVAH